MTTADAIDPRAVPGVVPRWEWRTFGDLDGEPGLLPLAGEPAVDSDEDYVLSLSTDASVKVRNGLLDVKVLHRVSAAGLQLWVPVMKAALPLDADDAATAYAALAAPGSASRGPDASGRTSVTDLTGTRDDLRTVGVRKARRRTLVDGCMVELTQVTVAGRTVDTVAVESPDPGLVVQTVRRLGLAGRRNTCMARGLKDQIGWGPSRYAVVDVGTNSVKLTQGDRHRVPDQPTEPDRAVVTRLGEGLAAHGKLSTDAIVRTVDAVADLVDHVRRGGPADIVAIGTAGLRQATNPDDFVEAVFSRCGVTVEVISGPEEARLAYLAAVSTIPLTGDRLLVFDSGGGSSQFTSGSISHIDEQISLDVGAVRFSERFGLTDAVPRETVDQALAAIADDLSMLEARPRPDMVIGIGGTATNLAAVRHGLVEYDADVVHGTVVDLVEVDRQIEEFRRRSAEDRRGIPGLQPARAEVILAGACIVRSILTLTGQDAVTVSDRGLRHGVAAERFPTEA